VIHGACPGRGDEAEHLGSDLSRRSTVVELERWRGGREETKSAFDMRLVLRSLHGGTDADRVAERGVDLGGVVRGLVVEQLGERSRARRRDAVSEGLDHRRRVLGVADRDADEGSRESITLQLEVELQELAADGDGHAHAVSHPLRAGKEGLKAAAQGQLVGAAPAASLRPAHAVQLEHLGDGVAPPADTELALDILAEVSEAAAPTPIRPEHAVNVRRREARARRSGDRRSVRVRRWWVRRRLARGGHQPGSKRARRHRGARGEVFDGQGCVLGAQLDEEAPETVSVTLAFPVAVHAPGVRHHEAQDRTAHRFVVPRSRRRLRLRRRSSHPRLESRREVDDLCGRLVRSAASHPRRRDDGLCGRQLEPHRLAQHSGRQEHGGGSERRDNGAGSR
jgi:hypothetical protein